MNPLFAVRDLLREHHVATLSQIAVTLQLSQPIVEQALAHWQRRGMVSLRVDNGCQSGGCSNCESGGCSSKAFYQWQPEQRLSPLHVNAKIIS
ncbi:FeoC-like transcriptional regulator [Celerinatantimonas yamalensis]|uniref:FeoC-like transcriptional regulator n=1 Tax=Celerinatantimonas yamalensis TaxID=559956 RepID=A0ABW9G3H0_9GAMM